MTMFERVYTLAMQSVDPEEASGAGLFWSVDEDELRAILEVELTQPYPVDFEYIMHEVMIPDELATRIGEYYDNDEIISDELSEEVMDYVEGVAWFRESAYDRVVSIGTEYPGGEDRRLEEEDDNGED